MDMYTAKAAIITKTAPDLEILVAGCAAGMSCFLPQQNNLPIVFPSLSSNCKAVKINSIW